MKACDRAMWFGVTFSAASAVSVGFRAWHTAVFTGLVALYWFLLMAALDAGEKPYRQFTMTYDEALAMHKKIHGTDFNPKL